MIRKNWNTILAYLFVLLLVIQVFSHATLSKDIDIEPIIDDIIDDDYDLTEIQGCGAYLLPDTVIPDEEPTSFATPPKTWDWTDATYNGISGNWLTSVKKQGECGSCWAFAAIAALEAMVNIQRNDPDLDLDLSEQQLVSCCRKGSNGCHGGSSYYSWEYLQDNGGSILEECFPYRGVDFNGCHSWKSNNCNREPVECNDQCDDPNAFTVPIERFGYYQEPDFNLIKNTVYNHGPIVAFILIFEDFNYYTGGIYEQDPNAELLGGHVVLITGYDDNEKYLICKNSWGVNWGENGYFRARLGEAMLGEQVFFVEVDEETLNFPPQANAGSWYAAGIDETIEFLGDESIDMDNNIVSYYWDFGDGTTSTQQNPTHSYNQKGIYPVTLTVVDSQGVEDIDQTTAYIDLWEIGDMWTYDIQFQTIPDALYPPIRLPVELGINQLTMTVVDESEDSYDLEVSGSLKGNMSFTFDTVDKFLDLQIWGKINRGTINGDLTISKKGNALEAYSMNIKGFSQFLGLPIIPIPIYVPLPFTISMNQEFQQPKSFIGTYPDVGNYWINPASNSSLEMVFSSMLGLISKSFDNDQVINEQRLFTISDYTSVSLTNGNYPCYELTSETSSQTNKIYYSTDIWNIVKFDISDPELFSMTGELKTSTYS